MSPTPGPELPDAWEVTVPDPDAMMSLGRHVADALRAGDVLVLDGGLGAGKTTFTRGLGEGLGVRGDVQSPTFVIAREHRGTSGRPGLVHVDAYRLGDAAELDDLDLEAALDQAVAVVEWGAGLAERLSDDRLHLHIVTEAAGAGSSVPSGTALDAFDATGVTGDAEGGAGRRRVRFTAVGERWRGVGLPGR